MSGVSAETARLALDCMRVVLRVSRHRRNGSVLPARWRVAADELAAVARQGTSASGHDVGAPAAAVSQWVSVGEVAERRRVSSRTVRRWAATGKVRARRIDGRTLLIGVEALDGGDGAVEHRVGAGGAGAGQHAAG